MQALQTVPSAKNNVQKKKRLLPGAAREIPAGSESEVQVKFLEFVAWLCQATSACAREEPTMLAEREQVATSVSGPGVCLTSDDKHYRNTFVCKAVALATV